MYKTKQRKCHLPNGDWKIEQWKLNQIAIAIKHIWNLQEENKMYQEPEKYILKSQVQNQEDLKCI